MPDSPAPDSKGQPLWVIPVCGIVAALVPVLRYGSFTRTVKSTSLPQGMLIAGLLGMAAGTVLVAKSHIRSVFWANIVLWFGILAVALGASIYLVLME